jgi:nucleoside 2-deoxyribosyltransferase
MGIYQQETCIFTDLPVSPILDGRDAIEYVLELNGNRHVIRLPYYATQWPIENNFFKKNKNLLQALLFNNKWFDDEKIFIELDNLKELIEKADYPKSPEEKLEALFLKLFSLQKEDGQKISLKSDYYKNKLWITLYFKSLNELNYYVQYLNEIGLIEANFGRTKDNFGELENYRISFKGLNRAIELQEKGLNSNLCFIAMSFKSETKPIREAIRSALIKTGFRAIIIDEENVDSDKTINDAIIANLKRCHFCISDFSFHSNGVYFESGFALGQGKKVIYTCSKEEFANAHFDIRPLQHIIYDSTDQLESDLINKIEAWIK